MHIPFQDRVAFILGLVLLTLSINQQVHAEQVTTSHLANQQIAIKQH